MAPGDAALLVHRPVGAPLTDAERPIAARALCDLAMRVLEEGARWGDVDRRAVAILEVKLDALVKRAA